MNASAVRIANQDLSKLGITIAEKDRWVVELEAIGQKPIKLTKDQLAAIAAWWRAMESSG